MTAAARRPAANPIWSANPRLLRDSVPAALPLWREALAAAEFSFLPFTPIFHGFGVPRGDGAAVILVPGFTATDGYLAPMRGWLRRIGYRPYRSDIGHNADCLDRLGKRLVETLQTAAGETGRRAHLVGHSLGGMLSRGVTCLRPDLVASVTTMGSPIRGVRSHPLVMRLAESVRRRVVADGTERDPGCFSGDCRCDLVRAVQTTFPEDVPQLAIFTRRDGVVAWRYTRLHDPSRNREVLGTHSGLAANPMAYYHLAHFLKRHPSLPQRPADAMLPVPVAAPKRKSRTRPAPTDDGNTVA